MGVNRVAPIITGQSTAQTINGSLKFDSGSSQYLNKTLSSGNRRTWTWSGWVKKLRRINVDTLFSAYSDGNNFTFIRWENSQSNLRVATQTGGVYDFDFVTTQYFRDYTGWMHVVISCDTTRVDSDRVKIYINGKSIESFSTNTQPSQNVDTFVNHNISHYIATTSGSSTSSLYLSNVYLIDGQALGPRFFGFTDPLTGTWRPKRLREGDTSLNDGTTWSDTYTASDSFQGAAPATNGFDGDITTRSACSSSGCTVTFTPSKAIYVNSTLRVYAGYGSASVNGRTSVSFSGSAVGWQDLNFTGNLISLAVTGNPSGGTANAGEIYAIEVDGEILTDSAVSAAFGTNGFYLPLDDQNDYTTDKSGKGNNWTASGFTGTSSNPDVVPDSPSGVVGSTKPTSGITTTSSITKPSNYATLNPLNNGHATAGGMTLSNGNLSATNDSTQRHIAANMAFPFPLRGKFYFEMTPGTQVTTPVTSNIGFGDYNVGQTGATNSYQNFYTRAGAFYIQGSGFVVNDAAYAFGDGDTIGCAIDFDSNIVKWYRNGSLQQSLSFPAPTVAVWPHYVSVNSPLSANFGQRPFKHQPPAGYLTLCSANVRPSTVVTRPDQYVGIVTYTGNQTARTLPLNFAADFVWTKRRDNTNSHQLYDQTRGNGNYLQTDGTGQADTDAAAMSFGTNKGINLGSGTRSNETGVSYVAWAWKAGGGSGTAGQFWKDDIQYASASDVPNFLTGSAIETDPDGCSIGTRQGFSIVTYAGDGANAVIPHGLTEQPNFVIIKRRNDIKHWMIAFPSSNPSATSATDVGRYLKFDNTTGTDVAPFQWLYTQSDRLILEQSAQGHNESGGTYVAYCWHNVPGVQKFGRYTGVDSTAGPFIELGFRPAVIMFKNITSATTDWVILDNQRNGYNNGNNILFPSTFDQENTTQYGDFLSNGFKFRINSSYVNASSNDYIYAAWAEAPSFNLYGGQSNAR